MKKRFMLGMFLAIPTWTVIFSFIPAEPQVINPWQVFGLSIQLFGLGLLFGAGGRR